MYRYVSLFLCVSFALVGLLFLLFPGGVIRIFNGFSSGPGREESPADGRGFYLVLAAGYMYLVAFLAYLMYRHPSNRFFPLLVINGKLFTALLSLYLVLLQGPIPIYIANAVVDGLIALVLIPFYLNLRKGPA
jgi:hypothetical protein